MDAGMARWPLRVAPIKCIQNHNAAEAELGPPGLTLTAPRRIWEKKMPFRSRKPTCSSSFETMDSFDYETAKKRLSDEAAQRYKEIKEIMSFRKRVPTCSSSFETMSATFSRNDKG